MSEESTPVGINIYGDFEEFCEKLGELRWLLREERKGLDCEAINKGIKFQVFEGAEEVSEANFSGDLIQFHLLPSKLLIPDLRKYIRFLLTLQAHPSCRECWIIDIFGRQGGGAWLAEIGYIMSMFPPDSVLTVTAHPESRQFELQRLKDRGIVETVSMDWRDDRMKFC